MAYYAYLKQMGEGCDYTIGCAQTLIKLEATTPMQIAEEVFRTIEENYCGDKELKSALVLTDDGCNVPFNLRECCQLIADRQRHQERAKQEATERAQLARLKVKWGEK